MQTPSFRLRHRPCQPYAGRRMSTPLAAARSLRSSTATLRLAAIALIAGPEVATGVLRGFEGRTRPLGTHAAQARPVWAGYAA